MTTDPTARALRLLSLLQTYKFWAGAELAERLDVSARTLRRDVDRLRELGYPVEATPGAAGGYRLSAGAHLPPLVLDDDEAVAIAVGLRAAAGASIEGIEETSVRALAKLEQVLPDRLRRRVNAVHSNVSSMRWGGDQATVDADALAVLALACRRPTQVSRRVGRATRRLANVPPRPADRSAARRCPLPSARAADGRRRVIRRSLDQCDAGRVRGNRRREWTGRRRPRADPLRRRPGRNDRQRVVPRAHPVGIAAVADDRRVAARNRVRRRGRGARRPARRREAGGSATAARRDPLG
jgi:biotin operon repressor